MLKKTLYSLGSICIIGGLLVSTPASASCSAEQGARMSALTEMNKNSTGKTRRAFKKASRKLARCMTKKER